MLGEVLEVAMRARGLTQAQLAEAVGVTAHMRRQTSTRVSLWKRAEAKLNMHRLHIAMLTARAPVQAQRHVPAYDYAFTSPVEAAQHTRTLWQLPLGPVRSVTALLESAGVIVIETDRETPRIDGLSQWSAENPIIFLN